jgi:3-hydroxymyristoyl/3-hydroxydecanoyl-(acyl carrier protein) dehydratase
VVPGDTLVLEVTALRIGSRVQRMRGEAKVDGQLAADAEIMSIVAPRESASV